MPRSQKPERRSVLIVDDHQLIRDSLVQMLRSAFDGAIVLEASSFDETLAMLDDRSIFLAVVDLALPGMGGPRDLERLRRKRPDVRVVVLTGSEERSDILAALTAGAHGYIIKKERREKVIAHIRLVADGAIYVPPELADLPALPVARGGSAEAAELAVEALTPRQKEVLALIIAGHPNKEIGRRLGIAEGTVKMHVTTTLRAIGAANRAHAAAIGRQYLGPARTP